MIIDEIIAKYAVDANLFRLGSTNTKKKNSAPGLFYFFRLLYWGLTIGGFCPGGFCLGAFCRGAFELDSSIRQCSDETPLIQLGI